MVNVSSWFLHLQMLSWVYWRHLYWALLTSNSIIWMTYSVPLLVCICLSCCHSQTFTIWIPSLSFQQDQKQIYSCMVSLVRSTYTMGNTPNSFIILNFGVEADFHPAIIDDISLSGKSQAIPSTLVSPLLSEMQVGIFFSQRNVFTKPFLLFSDIFLQF